MKHYLYKGQIITAESKEEAIRVFANSKPITVDLINKKNYKEYIGKYVNVTYDVDLSDLGLKELPIKFGNVSGDFICSGNKLASLNGAPKSVGGDFYCSRNNLISLNGAPKSVGGDFYCYSNKKKFTEDEVNKVSEVKGKITV